MAQKGTFGEVLRQLRQAAGLTQWKLAEKAAIAQKTVSNLERGKTAPNHQTLTQLADVIATRTRDRTQLYTAAKARWVHGLGPVRYVAFIFGGSLDSPFWHRVQTGLMGCFNDGRGMGEMLETVVLPLYHHESVAHEAACLRLCQRILPQLDGIIIAPACGTSARDIEQLADVCQLLDTFARLPLVFVDRYAVAQGTYADGLMIGEDGKRHLREGLDVGAAKRIPYIGILNEEVGYLATRAALRVWRSRRSTRPRLAGIWDGAARSSPSCDRKYGMESCAKDLGVDLSEIVSEDCIIEDGPDDPRRHQTDVVASIVQDTNRPDIIVCGTSHILRLVQDRVAPCDEYSPFMIACDSVDDLVNYPHVCYEPSDVAWRAAQRIVDLGANYDNEALHQPDWAAVLPASIPQEYLDKVLPQQ